MSFPLFFTELGVVGGDQSPLMRAPDWITGRAVNCRTGDQSACTANRNFPLSSFRSRRSILREGKGREAAAEFQKYVEHRGATVNCQLGALARLQLGRSFGLAGERDKARAAYQDFLTLWKDSQPRHPRLEARKGRIREIGVVICEPSSGSYPARQKVAEDCLRSLA